MRAKRHALANRPADLRLGCVIREAPAETEPQQHPCEMKSETETASNRTALTQILCIFNRTRTAVSAP